MKRLASLALCWAATACTLVSDLDEIQSGTAGGAGDAAPADAPHQDASDGSGGSGGTVDGSVLDGWAESAGGSNGGTGGSSGIPCNDCLAMQCTGALDTCSASTECVAIIECTQSCTDQDCVLVCMEAASQEGQDAYQALLACALSDCQAECQ